MGGSVEVVDVLDVVVVAASTITGSANGERDSTTALVAASEKILLERVITTSNGEATGSKYDATDHEEWMSFRRV
jgi:hypothetical protein